MTDEFHPTQRLADFLTIREHFGKLKGINFVYMGDARFNMGNSLMVGCAKMGLNFTACAPAKYFPDQALIEECRAKNPGKDGFYNGCLDAMDALDIVGGRIREMAEENAKTDFFTRGFATPVIINVYICLFFQIIA